MTDIFNRPATVKATIPNAATAEQGADGQVIQLSHQSDTSSDGKVLVITDEAGGGITETRLQPGPERQDRRRPLLEPRASRRAEARLLALPEPGARARSAGAGAGGDRPHRARRARSTSSATAATAAPGRARSPAGFDGVSRLPGRQFVTAPLRRRHLVGRLLRRRRARPTASPRTRARRGATRSAGT